MALGTKINAKETPKRDSRYRSDGDRHVFIDLVRVNGEIDRFRHSMSGAMH